MTIKIYKPSKTSMQSGFKKTKLWLAEYISEVEKVKDSLMGWNSSLDTKSQIKLFFDTKEQAIEWAKKNNSQYFVEEPKQRKIKPKSYASNFDTNRKSPTNKFGFIDPDGIVNGSYAKLLKNTATIIAIKKVLKTSIILSLISK